MYQPILIQSENPKFLTHTLTGMETSLSSLCQAFLDFLHDPKLMRGIQAEIDVHFKSSQIITLHDKWVIIINNL